MEVILFAEISYEDQYSEIPSEESSGLASIRGSVDWSEGRDGVEVSAVKCVSKRSSSSRIPTVTIMSRESPFTCGSKDCTEKRGQSLASP